METTVTPDDDRWGEVWTLAVGGHLHLNDVVDAFPPPGSPGWMPILEQLVDRLVGHGDNWTVTIDAGVVSRVPEPSTEVPDVFEHADQTRASEPPAVYHLPATLVPNTWEGEHHHWRRVLRRGVTEIVSFSRSRSDPPDGGGFVAEIAFEVRQAH
jgi:hypothetical protein